ncbi:MAG: TonB-dependent receptor [Pseudomonadales bacterium]|nr:TonB-dependent receptor [Pseudomonadales bacterium]
MKHLNFDINRALKVGLITSLLWGASGLVLADPSQDYDLDTLKSMSLEELVNVEVSIASKTSTKLSDTAAAVYVITAEEIKRSAATSIPELLRSVPGLHVAKINSNSWSIGTRGFGGQFANSLLVLMDGRSLYTPLFGGVFWDVQDTVLEDIERIEIIRGPGGAIWGSNAVNGVINIITKDASQTQENLISGTAGSHEQGSITVRHGAALSNDTSYRMYVKQRRLDNYEYQSGDSAEDDWQDRRAGFRIDSTIHENHQISFHGGAYKGNAAGLAYIPPISLPLPDALPASLNQAKFSGENLTFLWQNDGAEGSSRSLQLFYDHTYRQELLATEDRTTLDIEFQQNFTWSDQYTTVGAGYRETRDKLINGAAVSFDPAKDTNETWNAFVQNRSVNIIENLDMIVGVKIEGNDRMQSDYELQPSIRFNYQISETSTVWAALSKAIRSPTRVEQDATLSIFVPANTPVIGQSLNQPTLATLVATGVYDVEKLTSLEAGFRTNLKNNLRIDIAAYYNEFKGLPGLQLISGPVLNPGPPPTYAVSIAMINSTDFKAHGTEVSLWWQPSPQWQGRIHYSYANNSSNAGFVTIPTVEHQLNLNLYGTLSDDLTINIDARHVGAPAGLIMDEYVEMDLKLIWQVTPSLDISLAGRNLLHSNHLEYSASSPSTRNAEIERDFYLKLNWSL